MKTSRRAFLKFFIGGVAIAACPIPKFLLPKQKEEPIFFGVDWARKDLEPITLNAGGELTVQMIEDAAMHAAQNMGKADQIFMSMDDYKTLGKQFGFKVVYEGDEIIHYVL